MRRRSGRLDTADSGVTVGIGVLSEYHMVGDRDSLDTCDVHRPRERQRRGPVVRRLRAEHGQVHRQLWIGQSIVCHGRSH